MPEAKGTKGTKATAVTADALLSLAKYQTSAHAEVASRDLAIYHDHPSNVLSLPGEQYHWKNTLLSPLTCITSAR